jgi:hypothetical protein
MNYDENNEIEKTSIEGLWKILNRQDREVRIIGDDGKKHYPTYNRWVTKDGKDSITIKWTENDEPYAVDINGPVPVEEVVPNKEYIIWWYSDIPVRFVLVQPSF